MPEEMHMTHLRTLAAGLGLCVAIGLFACGNGAPAGSSGTGGPCAGTASGTAPGTPTVTINATDNLVFQPASSPAAVGDVIEFKNTGSVPHTVTFGAANASCLTDDTLNPGGTWYVKFTTPGTYKYLCTIHAPNMNGVLNVSGSAAPATSAAGATGTGGASPSPSVAATPTPST
jgi:plastocyanin